MHIRLLEPGDVPQLQALVNLLLSPAIPGWALSKAALGRHLVRDDRQPITDPWVDERLTYCALEGYRVLACVYLLHYGRRPEVSDYYPHAGSIA